MRTEKLMVCVYHGPSGERLIQRGFKIAGILECPLYVLHVQTLLTRDAHSVYEPYLKSWEKLTVEGGGQFLLRSSDGRRSADVIAQTAKDKHITQLIIGQSAQTRWQEITRGCFANELLNQLGTIDLHIAAPQINIGAHDHTKQYQAVGSAR